MARTITSAVVGAILGTLVAAVVLHSSRTGREVLTVIDSSTIDAAPSAETSVLAPASVPHDEGALEERLAAMTSPAERRAAALALVEAVGADREAVDRIAAAVPSADRLNFTFDALAVIASSDPDAAIRLALELGDRTASAEALARIGRNLAQGDARAALARARSIANYALHDAYVSSILEELAGTDVDEFLDLLVSDRVEAFLFTDKAFETAAAIDAERLLALADAIPARVRVAAVSSALEGLARSDVNAAVEYVEGQPPGPNRDGLLGVVARAFALHDLEGAVTWMNALPGRPSRAVAGVLSVIAEAQPVRAVDLLILNLPPSGTMNGSSELDLVISSFTPGPRESLAVVADRLSGQGAATLAPAFDSFMDYWSQNDLDAAYEWTRLHSDRLTPTSLYALARNVGGRRDLAKEAVSWLPADQHRGWVLSIARELAQDDLDDTLDWLERFREQHFYGDATRFALEALSSSRDPADPVTAARFLESRPPGVRAVDAIDMVVRAWARHDPEAAARWVRGASLAEVGEASRAGAIGTIASVWAERDHDAAREWALRLDSIDLRNRALTSVLSAGAAAGRLDTQVLAAFGSEQERQKALASALPRLGARDPEQARRLIAQYLTDPALRAQAEATLLRASSLPPGMFIGN